MVLGQGLQVDLGALGPAWVTAVLGEGGQGYVYAVRRPSGEELALKWYKPSSATARQFDDVQRLVELGSPHHRFLWPLSTAMVAGMPGFGYVMHVRADRFLELSHLLLGTGRDGEPLEVPFATILELCRQLCHSFLRLHSYGLCYRDISFGNVFFDPATGEVLICDNDNVGIDDGTGRVLGTPYFMAPEVVRDTTYATLPSSATDRHSLAVLLFYALMLGHPLEGARTVGVRDAEWLQRHLGTDPLFCLHPTDTSNRPGGVVEQYWDIYPPVLRELFVQAFVDGLEHPAARVTESQWIKAFDRLSDGLMTCPTCGAGVFWTPDGPAACWRDGTAVAPALVLRVGRRTVALSARAVLRADHLDPGVDDPTVLARAKAHPADAGRFGLHNVSDLRWSVAYPDGRRFDVDPGRTIELVDDARIRLGDTDVVVRVQPAPTTTAEQSAPASEGTT